MKTHLHGARDERAEVGLRPEGEVEREREAREVDGGEGEALRGDEVLDVRQRPDEDREAAQYQSELESESVSVSASGWGRRDAPKHDEHAA